MMTRFAFLLFCTTAPLTLLAQEVSLESPDQFISVRGEIIGFNGVMVQVQSPVGTVSVPASEVICIGESCLTTIASNDFGLTASAFIDVVTEIPSPAAIQQTPQVADTLQTAFASPAIAAAFNASAAAFSVSDQTSLTVAISAEGEISLADPADGTTLRLVLTNDLDAADVAIEAVSLNGTAPQAFANATGWATAQTLPYQLLGLQSFSVMIAPTAGIESISLDDLARIYAGEVTSWSELGGADVSILPLQLPQTSPLRAAFEALVMAPAEKQMAGNVLIMADEAGITASISQFPGSLSIVSSQNANAALTVPVAGSCGIAVAPNPFNIKSGDYPLIRPIMADFRGNSGGALATELFDFATTATAQDLVTQTGFTGLSAQVQDGTVKNGRLGGLLNATLDDVQRAAAGQMFQTLFDADRLSPTFIGGPASGSEGAWNRAMLQSVIDALADPANAGREIIFVGKGKSADGSQAAVSVSLAAAQALQSALEAVAIDAITQSGVTVSTYGFGDVAEVGCINSQVARADSARVEVWIR